LILIALIIFAAALVQGVMGFGGALIAMPLLAAVLGIKTAVPAFALIGAVTTLFNTLRLRRHATPRDLVRLALPAMAGIPLGIWLLAQVDSVVVTRALGAILMAYAGFSLLGIAMPALRHPAWAWGIGFTSGVLTGAYNTGGPPVVVYAAAQRWSADRFRANLQTYFLLSGILVVVLHGASGHLTHDVWRYALVALPALLLGQFVGARICHRLDAEFFRKLVLIFLVILGTRLLLL
jgi:uncharacterized membrane protein YfcA